MQNLLKSALFSLSFCSISLAQEAIDDSSAPVVDQALIAYPKAKAAGETGSLNGIATIKVTENHYFLNGSDTNALIMSWGNLSSSYAGAIVHKDLGYVITFEFEDTGYIKDEDKDDLDADELMESFEDNQELANEECLRQGLTTSTLSWSHKPEYLSDTNRVVWGLFVNSSDNTTSVNHEIRLLGRKGVMSATIICDPSQVEAIIPVVDNMLEGYAYNDGEKYAQFEEGDKISEYGLKGLIIGGGVFAAAKLGIFALLAKSWKWIVGGIVAVGAGIKKFFVKS